VPSGQTYRVSGRPHPDGAIAFLFEDISDEVSLTRRFRSEIETTQSVMNLMDEAFAVFSATGTLVLANAGYDALWSRSAQGLLDIRLTDEIDRWRTRAVPTHFWVELQVAAAARLSQSDKVCLDDGRVMAVRLVPLPHGAMMVGFRGAATPDSVVVVPSAAQRVESTLAQQSGAQQSGLAPKSISARRIRERRQVAGH
jgi:PAS domain-containing protein